MYESENEKGPKGPPSGDSTSSKWRGMEGTIHKVYLHSIFSCTVLQEQPKPNSYTDVGRGLGSGCIAHFVGDH